MEKQYILMASWSLILFDYTTLNNGFIPIKSLRLIFLQSSNCMLVKSFCQSSANIIAIGSVLLLVNSVSFSKNRLMLSDLHFPPCQTPGLCVSSLFQSRAMCRVTLIFPTWLSLFLEPLHFQLPWDFPLHCTCHDSGLHPSVGQTHKCL